MLDLSNVINKPNPLIPNHKIFYEEFIQRLENNQLSRNYFFNIIVYDQPSCGIKNNFLYKIHEVGNKMNTRITIVLNGANAMILKHNNSTFTFYQKNTYTVEDFITLIRKNIIN